METFDFLVDLLHLPEGTSASSPSKAASPRLLPQVALRSFPTYAPPARDHAHRNQCAAAGEEGAGRGDNAHASWQPYALLRPPR